jgi:hypothetical protein
MTQAPKHDARPEPIITDLSTGEGGGFVIIGLSESGDGLVCALKAAGREPPESKTEVKRRSRNLANLPFTQ